MKVDQFRGQRSTMIFWNLETGKKGKMVVLDSLRETREPANIKIVQGEDEIISRIEGPKIWKID